MPKTGARNGTVNGFYDEQDSETLRKTLTHVDLANGLRNRNIKRDPISGLGTLSTGSGETKRQPRAQSLGRRSGLNAKLISWDADAPLSEPVTETPRRQRVPERNPIALTGELGAEVDSLRTTNRPRGNTPREPRRDPISGRGDFGEREWDPVWKYNGRIRRSKSSNTLRSDPLTGQNMKTFEFRTGEHQRKGNVPAPSKNVLTGDNCSTYTFQPGMKSSDRQSIRSIGRNTITGENCASFDVNSEVQTPRRRVSPKSTNPLNGENVNSFTFSHEERPRSTKPYVYTNTLTGENVPSYKINPQEKTITPREVKAPQNPLNGENMSTYTYRSGERNLSTRKRDISSPITGEGSRGRTYGVSTEERPGSSGNSIAQQNFARARSQGSLRNAITGENCDTYLVYREMRSEKGVPRMNSGATMKNIIAGL